MIYYKSLVVSGVANTETLGSIITSTSTEKYHIRKLYVSEITSTAQNDGYIRAYIEREKIADVPVEHWLDNLTANSRIAMTALEFDFDLDVGESFYVGQLSQATASDFVFTIEYEIAK